MAKKEATSISYRKVIQIDIEVHKMLKDYCDREGLRMGPAATKMIKESLGKKLLKSVDTGR